MNRTKPPDPTSLLRELVRIPSVTGNEAGIIACVARFCRDHLLPCEEAETGVTVPLIRGSDRALIFNAHLDTVGPGDTGRWQYPPFGPEAGVTADGRLYGLGASDDKAGVAALLSLAATLDRTHLPIDSYFSFVTGEELDGSGTRAFLKKFLAGPGYRETAAVIAESTGLVKTEVGHRGSAFIKLTTAGDSGHTAQPGRIKRQAPRAMLELINRMDALADRARTRYRHETLGEPTFCLTGLRAASGSANKLPADCVSTWDIRTTPGLEEQLDRLLAETVGARATIEHLKSPSPCGITSPDSKIVRTLQKLVPGLAVVTSPASNDICFFTRAGIPAVTFGPGDKTTIHRENESVETANLDRAVSIYRELIQSF